jgi:DNA-binding response OmpR family regulator
MTEEKKEKKKILLIEDEEDMAYAITLQLESKGFEVIVAHDGRAGLEKARIKKPDLIILDVMLPKIDGYKICRMLKFDNKYKNIPIIIYTARAQDSDKKLAEEVGADAYITKPFEIEALLDKMRELLTNI